MKFDFSAEIDAPRFLNVGEDRRVKRPRATIVLLHGLGCSADVWHGIIEQLPQDTRVITLDLLGFGDSPKPKKASYNLRVQARSIAATLVKMRLNTRVIVVGHSMGALVAIELARRYKPLVRGLILCSPPIYQDTDQQDERMLNAEAVLTKIYRFTANDAGENPKFYIILAKIASTIGIAPGLDITKQNIHSYIKALRRAIIRQTSFEDIQKVKVPIEIVYSKLDPFVIHKNIKFLARQPNITTRKVFGLHEITKPYLKPIRRAVTVICAKRGK